MSLNERGNNGESQNTISSQLEITSWESAVKIVQTSAAGAMLYVILAELYLAD